MKANRSSGAASLSLNFYIGMVAVLVLIAAGLLATPRPLVDQHANPTPASSVPADVITSPGSNLYHASTGCPYLHTNAETIADSEAVRRGLVPCPYCIGNSSARLTPVVSHKR